MEGTMHQLDGVNLQTTVENYGMNFYIEEAVSYMNFMKAFFYKSFFRLILLTGIVIGIVKGQEARQKWVTKKKNKYEAKKGFQKKSDASLIVLDEIEMSTYHS